MYLLQERLLFMVRIPAYWFMISDVSSFHSNQTPRTPILVCTILTMLQRWLLLQTGIIMWELSIFDWLQPFTGPDRPHQAWKPYFWPGTMNLFVVIPMNTLLVLMDIFYKIPDSGLINGAGRYNGGPQVVRARIKVQSGKRYRFRVINISAYAAFRFSIENHPITIIEVNSWTWLISMS